VLTAGQDSWRIICYKPTNFRRLFPYKTSFVWATKYWQCWKAWSQIERSSYHIFICSNVYEK